MFEKLKDYSIKNLRICYLGVTSRVGRFPVFCRPIGTKNIIIAKEVTEESVQAIRNSKVYYVFKDDDRYSYVPGNIMAYKIINLYDFLLDNGYQLNNNNLSYSEIVKLEDAFIQTLDFKKQNGLIPTIVQDYKTKQVLMLAYSNVESVKKSLCDGVATYFSRSRNELWTKGKTSGNIQELLKARYDCDCDTLLYIVNQTGNACHLNRFSCFDDKNFNLQELYNLLLERKEKMPEKSFTTKLYKDRNFLNSKILEEANEVTSFEKGEDTLSWEVADLTYFVLALMVQNNVKIENIISELASRTK